MFCHVTRSQHGRNMAAVKLCQLAWLGYVVALGAGFTLISPFPDDIEQCEIVCQNTYSPHTYDKVFDMGYCMRGCRFFSLIQFAHEGADLNTTLNQCKLACGEAYTHVDDQEACSTGCKSQLPLSQKRQQMLQVELSSPQVNPIYPLLYVHSVYSNMMDRMVNHICETWSYYHQGDWSGKIIITEYGGKNVFSAYEAISPRTGDYKTANYLETNLAAVDNSATPNIKRSVLPLNDLSLDGEINLSEEDDMPTDWLGCVAKKTGLPRLFISFTIFISAMMMVWLCFASIATAPEHKIIPQKLSINGDLEYLLEMGEKKDAVYTQVRLQEDTDAAPLPFKIQLQQV